MTDLITFLNARLDEDEAFAMAAAGADGKYGGRPHWTVLGRGIVTDSDDPDWAVVDLSPCIEDASLAAHIARHDPAHALRQIRATREIVRWHAAECTCSWCTADGEDLDEPDFAPACPTLCFLAAIYRDHPDYRQEWAVSP